MRIVLHAGLHKSGTTSVQSAWRAAYPAGGPVWFPTRPGARAPGHHGLVRPLLSAFAQGLALDTVATTTARSMGRDRRDALAKVVHQAIEAGVETLVLSSEDLDRVRSEDSAALAWLLDDHEVHLLLTVTRPVHRWCSGWQTLVKHGLAQYPRDAEAHVVDFAALAPGRLAEIVSLLPGARRTVRLVRTAPPEPELARDLARSAGLPDPDVDDAVDAGVRNASLGVDTEIVRRINRADLALGTDRAGRELLERFHSEGFGYRDDPSLAAGYELPETVSAAAETEQHWLRSAGERGDVELVDPHRLLGSWTAHDLPDWYAEISRREAVIPDLDGAEDPETQLWRARQQRAAYQKRAVESRG